MPDEEQGARDAVTELTPGLTTMALPHRAMGQEAARALIAQLQGAEPRGEVLVPCLVVRRGSVGPAHR